MHLLSSIPENSYCPPIAKIKKKKIKTIRVLSRGGIAATSVMTRTLRPSMPEIVLKGLRTLKLLKTERFIELLPLV
jgi:hypothetical protein